MSSGLRERKKEQTRQEISDTATALFAGHGFDQVTIAQVAEAAGVSKMTVTNYFPRKEDLVYDRAGHIIGGLAQAVRDRRPGESLLDAARRDYAGAVARRDVTLGVAGQRFAAMVAGSPVLTSRFREILDLREAALASQIEEEGLRRDTGRGPAVPGDRGAAGRGAPGAVRRGHPPLPGRPATRRHLARAGAGRHPGLRSAGARPGRDRHPPRSPGLAPAWPRSSPRLAPRVAGAVRCG